ncbi:hypothetical protein [Rasiella sp. SM2506]|uniref:hypothetical protein n=1 Tax=Rasiella sp. SM2506 TaxID=3423914 RepID=UPI003D7B9675
MEPNKFEENIRTKLEERELQPSTEAWSKLEAQLGAPKSSNKTLWYAIAASLVAVLVVGSFLLKENKTVSNEIVEQTIPSESINKTEVATSEEEKTSEITGAEDAVKTEAKINTETLSKNTEQWVATASGKNEENIEEREEKEIITTNAETKIAHLEKTYPKTEAIKKLESNDFIKLKVDEVVAQVESLQKTNSSITAEAIEALLQKAQRDIANQRLLQQATVTIDPASLLNDVENELERGFRDKVFDALGEGFNKVRTAVLERNN